MSEVYDIFVADTAAPAGQAVCDAPRRAAAARGLCDVIALPADRASANERALAVDILLYLFNHLGLEDRIEVARRLAGLPETPQACVRRLLTDHADLAHAYFEAGGAPSEAVLIAAARNGDMAHRLAIARRAKLTPALADALAEFEEREVLFEIARRMDVQLAPVALAALAACAADQPEMIVLLARRPDIEPALAFDLYWFADAPERKRILGRFSIERKVLRDALPDLSEPEGLCDPVVARVAALLDRRAIARAEGQHRMTPPAILSALREAYASRDGTAARPAGDAAKVSPELVARILSDPGGEPFAVFAKASGLTREEFGMVLDAPVAAVPAARWDQSRLWETFDTIATDFAQTVLKYWDWRDDARIHASGEGLDAGAYFGAIG